MNVIYFLLAILALLAFGAAMLFPMGNVERRVGFIAIGLFLSTAISVLTFGDRVF